MVLLNSSQIGLLVQEKQMLCSLVHVKSDKLISLGLLAKIFLFAFSASLARQALCNWENLALRKISKRNSAVQEEVDLQAVWTSPWFESCQDDFLRRADLLPQALISSVTWDKNRTTYHKAATFNFIQVSQLKQILKKESSFQVMLAKKENEVQLWKRGAEEDDNFILQERLLVKSD